MENIPSGVWGLLASALGAAWILREVLPYLVKKGRPAGGKNVSSSRTPAVPAAASENDLNHNLGEIRMQLVAMQHQLAEMYGWHQQMDPRTGQLLRNRLVGIAEDQISETRAMRERQEETNRLLGQIHKALKEPK